MCMARFTGLGVLLLLCRTAAADSYFTYHYGNFEVTSSNPERAVTLAHHLVQLDEAMASLQRLPEQRLPTHIDEVPSAQLRQIIGTAAPGTGDVRFDGFEVTVISTEGTGNTPYWGALFGYVQSLAYSAGGGRLPLWFMTGKPEVFADSEFRIGAVVTGELQRGWIAWLNSGHGHTLPLRQLLRIQNGDPQLRDSTFHTSFSAESWFLTHSVYAENFFFSEFGKYLNLIAQGTPEADAFAASFPGKSYEDLDRGLAALLQQSQLHHFRFNVTPLPPDSGTPRRLSQAESQAFLASLQLQWGHPAEALTLARAAVQADARSEPGLRVLARASLTSGDLPAALTAADALGSLEAPSAAALTDRALLLAQLSTQLRNRPDALGNTTEADLRQASREAYEKAIVADGDYLRAWAALATVFTKDEVAAAEAFAARAQPVLERHPQSSPLARTLAQMCARTGQSSHALLFAQMWHASAMTQQDLTAAERFLAQLKSSPQ